MGNVNGIVWNLFSELFRICISIPSLALAPKHRWCSEHVSLTGVLPEPGEEAAAAACWLTNPLFRAPDGNEVQKCLPMAARQLSNLKVQSIDYLIFRVLMARHMNTF